MQTKVGMTEIQIGLESTSPMPTIRMHVLYEKVLHGRMTQQDARMLMVMDGTTSKMHSQLTIHNGAMKTVMDTAITNLEQRRTLAFNDLVVLTQTDLDVEITTRMAYLTLIQRPITSSPMVQMLSLTNPLNGRTVTLTDTATTLSVSSLTHALKFVTLLRLTALAALTATEMDFRTLMTRGPPPMEQMLAQ